VFKYGGSDGKKYPKAVDVVLEHDGDYEDDDEEYEDGDY
jgi:hypothetical protein